MRYRVVSGVGLGRGKSGNPGDIIEVPKDLDTHLARALLARGRIVAEEAAPAPPAHTAHAADEVAHGDPEPEDREPRRRRG